MTQQAQQEQLEREADAHRRIAEVLDNKDFMRGVYEAMTDTEPAVEWKDLKRK